LFVSDFGFVFSDPLPTEEQAVLPAAFTLVEKATKPGCYLKTGSGTMPDHT